MKLAGQCHRGAIRYEIEGENLTHGLCHCRDCRRHSGAPMVSWAMFPADAVKTERGQPKIYKSSEHGRRHFCAECGTGLFYTSCPRLTAFHRSNHGFGSGATRSKRRPQDCTARDNRP
jgi:hypothetical protein